MPFLVRWDGIKVGMKLQFFCIFILFSTPFHYMSILFYYTKQMNEMKVRMEVGIIIHFLLYSIIGHLQLIPLNPSFPSLSMNPSAHFFPLFIYPTIHFYNYLWIPHFFNLFSFLYFVIYSTQFYKNAKFIIVQKLHLLTSKYKKLKSLNWYFI